MTRKRRGLSMTSILVLALVGTITAIVLGAMAVFLQTYQRSLIRNVQTSARQSVAQVGKTVEDYLDDVNSLMELLERKLEDPRQDRDDFFAAFLQIRPDVVAVTTYDAAGGLVDCRSRGAKRTEIYQNLSFDPDKMDDYADGYVSTPHVASIFQGYYPWVVTLVAPLDAPGREEWIALDISFSSISAYLNDVGIGQHGYCFLMDQSGNIIYHPQQQLIYSDLKRENTSLIAGLPDGSNESGSMIYTLTSLENSHWRVVGVSFVEELITESVQEVSRILAASGIGILLAAVMVMALLAGCGSKNSDKTNDNNTPNNNQNTELSGSVSTNGSTSMDKVIGALREQFMADHKNVTVTYDPTGSGSGIEAVKNGTADIGLASRSLKDEEKADGLTETVIALDGIAVIVNAQSKVTDLTVEQIAKIFTGEITDWSEVGGDPGAISCIGRESGSGTRDGFESITGTKDSCKLDQELTSTGGVIEAVAGNPNAIGYASLSAVEGKDTVKAVTAGGVACTESTVLDGSYAIQRPFVLVTKDGTTLSPAAQAFFDFATSKDAASLIQNAGAVPTAK